MTNDTIWAHCTFKEYKKQLGAQKSDGRNRRFT